MQKEREPVYIPFVAGKSLNKSHNIGIRIQQTKSLMLRTQSNKKIKLRKSPSPSEDNISRSSRSATTNIHRRNSDTCPVLKYQSLIRPNLIEDDEYNKTPVETRTIEEKWADYMFNVESKNIIPLKCTCFQLKTKKPDKDQDDDDELYKKIRKQKSDHTSIYSEVRKVMNDCRLVLSEDEMLSDDDFSIIEDTHKKPTRSTKMARYMQQIKQLQERLSKDLITN